MITGLELEDHLPARDLKNIKLKLFIFTKLSQLRPGVLLFNAS